MLHLFPCFRGARPHSLWYAYSIDSDSSLPYFNSIGRIGVRSGYLPFPTHVLVKAQAYPSLHLVPSIVDHRRNLLLPSFLTSLTGLGPNDHHIGFSRRLRHEARQDRACILELSLPKGLAKRGCSVNGPRRTECGTCRESTRFVSGLPWADTAKGKRNACQTQGQGYWWCLRRSRNSSPS